MARAKTILALGLATVPYAIIAFQGPQKLTPIQAQTATQAVTLLKARCASCHAGANPSAGLNLTTVAGIAKGGDSGPIFTAGHGAESLLIKRLKGGPNMERMPMGFTPFTAEQIQLITDWIDSGGQADVVAPHWAYQPVSNPPVPTDGKGWAKNPIDNFIAARLKKEGLRPSKEADRATLIRRASLDIIGLPPTPEEVDAFLKDTRPHAYELLVDRLLASPHYGEKQARGWLDLARYADSDGYEKDLSRTNWKWRDWVINAYNQNLPYDKFTIDQLAGDQLPNPTVDDLVATGFNRNTMQNLEGGVDQEEAHFLVVLDRVSTTGTVWLGETIGCARCHDHKYDPISQKDFYRMAAFFSNSKINAVGPKSVGEEKWFESTMKVPTTDQRAQKISLTQKVNGLNNELKKWTPALEAGYRQWTTQANQKVNWSELSGLTAKSSQGSTLSVLPDASILASGKAPATDTYRIQGSTNLTRVAGLRLRALTDKSLVNKGPGRADNGNFVVTKLSLLVDGKPVKLNASAADYSQPRYPASAAIEGVKGSGWAVVEEIGTEHELVADFAQLTVSAGSKIEVVVEQNSEFPAHTLGHFSVELTGEESPTTTFLSQEAKGLLAKANRSEADETKLKSIFVKSTPLLAGAREEQMTATSALNDLNNEIPSAMIMKDNPSSGPLTAYMRNRGEFLSKEELVTAGTPAILPPMPAKPRVNRLDLAKWIVSANNPLTPRVEINRMWEAVFGRGIVETSENFGTMGSPPSHPELLDWLSHEFVAKGWDIKAMQRLILTSATYRQSSDATPELIEKDPINILLARGPRFRMSAEGIRDTVLKASGLLSDKIGGPSVYPYQPTGVWNVPYSGEQWMESKGGDQFRRGLYTFWKRSTPYPSFAAFDATSREECTVRRIRTNTPLQALAMLNDEATFVAAKSLGKEMKSKGIEYGFRACTSREPTQYEKDRLHKLLVTMQAKYAKPTEETKKLGPDAAWTMVANVLLNLDETLTKS